MPGADLRIQYNEKMVGNASPSYADTLNRHANAYHLQDGINVLPYGESIAAASTSLTGNNVWLNIPSTDLTLGLAGIYKITAFMTSIFIKSNVASDIEIDGRLINVTQATLLPNSEFVSSYCNDSGTNNDAFKGVGVMSVFTTTTVDSDVIRLQARKLVGAGGTLGTPNIITDGTSKTKIIYERIG